MTQHYNNSIFWVETEKISPNPYQPRREFDERALVDLADSIRQYGVLQPLVVTRRETEHADGGLSVTYELIAGERRLRASKIAGLPQVPVIIRSGSEDSKMKLELAIIENLQREDLNPIDRAWAFMRLHSEFGFTHAEIGKKMGKSREYVSNSLRLLALPQDIMIALQERKISEGHTRPLMMLTDRPEEQTVLFKEIMIKKLSVREAEQYARSIAKDKVRKKEANHNPQIANYEEKFAESLGTRVHIEQREVGGKIVIDFFSPDDLDTILGLLKNNQTVSKSAMLDNFISQQEQVPEIQSSDVQIVQEAPVLKNDSIFAKPEVSAIQSEVEQTQSVTLHHEALPEYHAGPHSEIVVAQTAIEAPEIEPSYLAKNEPEMEQVDMLDDRSNDEVEQDENTDLYNVNNFTL